MNFGGKTSSLFFLFIIYQSDSMCMLIHIEIQIHLTTFHTFLIVNYDVIELQNFIS